VRLLKLLLFVALGIVAAAAGVVALVVIPVLALGWLIGRNLRPANRQPGVPSRRRETAPLDVIEVTATEVTSRREDSLSLLNREP
jgi:hypothetical protein